MVRKGEKFNDPILDHSNKIVLDKKSIVRMILIVVVGGVVAYMLMGAFNNQEDKVSPDYIDVKFSDDVLYIKYSGESQYIGVDVYAQQVVSEGIRVYSTKNYAPFNMSVSFKDRKFIEYRVSISETINNETFNYYWIITKNALGMIELRYL